MGPRRSFLFKSLRSLVNTYLIYTKEVIRMIDSQLSANSPLIFLDIDGTLLDSRYNSNDTTLAEYINKLQKERGFIFALNLNRSLEDIAPIAKQFSIDGPLIGENGIFAYSLKNDRIQYFLDEPELKRLVVDKEEVQTLILRALEAKFSNQKVIWRNIDTVKAISEKIIDAEYQEGDIIVLNNVFRQHTISAHLFRFTGGRLKTIPVPIVKTVLKLIRAEYKKRGLVITYDPNFSNILVYSKNVSKNSAVKKVVDAYPNLKLYAVGDSMSDYEMVKDIGTFLAVANAPKDVRRKATFSSEAVNAQGVRELLGKI